MGRSEPFATLRSEEGTLVLKISRAQLQGKLDDDNAFAARFHRSASMLLSDRLRSANKQLACILKTPAHA
jgi:hypothetical protein